MATIALYAGKLNQMPGLILDIKKSVMDYKAELEALKDKTLQIDRNVCELEEVISSIQASSRIQDAKIASLEALESDSEEFIEDVARIDCKVAEVIRQRQDDFYDAYNYLKPDCEKNGWEKFCSFCKNAGEWCKERWVMIVTVLVVIAIAVIAVVTFGVAVAAVAAIAGIVSLVLCAADVICVIATGGKNLSTVFRENGWDVLADIFQGLQVGCDIVSIVFPAGAAIKTMSKVGIKSFAKGSIQAAKFAFEKMWKEVFESGVKNGIKNFGKILFKTFVFDIDDFSRVNSSGKRVFDIFEHTMPVDIPRNIEINRGGLNPDGSIKKVNGFIVYPDVKYGYPDGFDGPILQETLEPGLRIDRYGKYTGYYASPEGTPFANRAMPPENKYLAYTVFKVNNPTETQSGRIASWFGEPGGGQQFKFDNSIQQLLEDGKLKIIDYSQITLKGLTHWSTRELPDSLVGNAAY